MPSQTFDKISSAPRDRLLWAVVGLLVLGQLVAFYMLCNEQVRKAQVRDATLHVQRLAIIDCLQYTPRATLNSCTDKVAPLRRETVAQGGYLTVAGDGSAVTASR